MKYRVVRKLKASGVLMAPGDIYSGSEALIDSLVKMGVIEADSSIIEDPVFEEAELDQPEEIVEKPKSKKRKSKEA